MCGCNKNKNTVNRTAPLRPGRANLVSSPNVSPQVRSQSLPAVPPNPPNEAGLNASKRKVQAIRREIIRRTFGK